MLSGRRRVRARRSEGGQHPADRQVALPTDGSRRGARTRVHCSRDESRGLQQPLRVHLARRTRGKKGSYRLAPLDVDHPEAPYRHLRDLPDCVAILSPAFPANEQSLDAQIEWFARVFGDRAWVGRVPRGTAEQPADGLLHAIAAGAGCAPAWCSDAARRRQCEHMGWILRSKARPHRRRCGLVSRCCAACVKMSPAASNSRAV